ncbi:phosphotransferase [Jeotgalibacillus aurantiacus]|uniref:phosphotransferase n=1 Tax=Jeotgalibacillus aurantiacus TaxID=2763266 RepID=UPI001D0A9968|nr:phosphotransferase [Jeotgalibacillus aurantiacus]
MVQIKHSLISEEAVKGFAHAYDLGGITDCRFLARGLNDTYVIHTKDDQYIYRIYRHGWRDDDAILYELDAILYAAKEGIKSSVPVKRKDGEFLTPIEAPEGRRYGVMFTYSKGDRPEITEENSGRIGRALANLHHATDKFKTKHPRGYELNTAHLVKVPASIIMKQLGDKMSEEQETLLYEVVSKVKDKAENPGLSYGFCHGDFHNFNFHLYDGELEAFDYDCCGLGFRAYDLAVFWWNLKNNYPQQEKTCWRSFLHGYESIRPLKDEDKEALPYFVAARRIWFLGILAANEDVWGRAWMNNQNLNHFFGQLASDVKGFGGK